MDGATRSSAKVPLASFNGFYGSIFAGRLPRSELPPTTVNFADDHWSADLDSGMLLPFHGWNALPLRLNKI
jgi:hypothetical protein